MPRQALPWSPTSSPSDLDMRGMTSEPETLSSVRGYHSMGSWDPNVFILPHPLHRQPYFNKSSYKSLIFSIVWECLPLSVRVFWRLVLSHEGHHESELLPIWSCRDFIFLPGTITYRIGTSLTVGCRAVHGILSGKMKTSGSHKCFEFPWVPSNNSLLFSWILRSIAGKGNQETLPRSKKDEKSPSILTWQTQGVRRGLRPDSMAPQRTSTLSSQKLPVTCTHTLRHMAE